MYKNSYALIKEDEREKTIEEFIPIIKHLAYKVCKGFEEGTIIEDLISAGIIGLLEAMEKYDVNRGNQTEHLCLHEDQGRHDRRASFQGLVPQKREVESEKDRRSNTQTGKTSSAGTPRKKRWRKS